MIFFILFFQDAASWLRTIIGILFLMAILLVLFWSCWKLGENVQNQIIGFQLENSDWKTKYLFEKQRNEVRNILISRFFEKKLFAIF